MITSSFNESIVLENRAVLKLRICERYATYTKRINVMKNPIGVVSWGKTISPKLYIMFIAYGINSPTPVSISRRFLSASLII
jgi:hypothetical protein